ncbi:hypothetical protein [Dubosiella newyorkensis]|uniref:hypothetical protein n=1 Tax=Dubosiella newyorkensis TaxID=1862672 RepID=UPI003F662CC6
MKVELYGKNIQIGSCAPDRSMSQGGHQYVLDFSNLEVVDYIFGLLVKVPMRRRSRMCEMGYESFYVGSVFVGVLF